MPKNITITVYSFKELLELEKEAKLPALKRQTAKAVEKAREYLSEIATSDEWWDMNYEQWKDALDQIGFTNADINFSGFWSQGDGASFTADVDVERLASFMSSDIESKDSILGLGEGQKLFGHSEDFRNWIVHKIGSNYYDPKYRFLGWASNSIHAGVGRRSSHYVHKHTCSFEAEFDPPGELGDAPDYKFTPKHKRLCAAYEEWVPDVEALRLDLCKAIYHDLEEQHEYLTSDENLIEISEANEWSFSISGRPE